jgi:hypothetical protein
MRLSDHYLKNLIQEEVEKNWDLSKAGACDPEFFGILVGYLGSDPDLAAQFCEIAMDSETDDPLGRAIREFNLGMDAEFEIRQAYKAVFGDDGDEEYLINPAGPGEMREEVGGSRMGSDPGEVKKCKSGQHRCTSGGKCTSKVCNHPVKGIATLDMHEYRKNKKMNLRKLLEKMILREINISVGGAMEEDFDADEEGGEVEGEPADYGSTATMGSISEDWDDRDPYDAPPAGSMPRERPERQEIDQVINNVIIDLERAPDQMDKRDVIALLQHIANIYLGG